jgi:hypothetical protein
MKKPNLRDTVEIARDEYGDRLLVGLEPNTGWDIPFKMKDGVFEAEVFTGGSDTVMEMRLKDEPIWGGGRRFIMTLTIKTPFTWNPERGTITVTVE